MFEKGDIVKVVTVDGYRWGEVTSVSEEQDGFFPYEKYQDVEINGSLPRYDSSSKNVILVCHASERHDIEMYKIKNKDDDEDKND